MSTKGLPSSGGLSRWLAGDAAGGVVLALAALLALVVANSRWGDAYAAWLATPGVVSIGPPGAPWLLLAKPLVVWVNDLWMAIFFFFVGLEIKREFVAGELSSRRQALLPAAAALGGMVVPALIYALVNRGDAVALRGWAIPSATDIAFAIAVLALLGSRVPASLKVFLTAVAIIDDLGAIVVIALFYTEQLSLPMLGSAALGIGLLVLLNRAGVTRVDVYAVVGLAIWLAVLKSGVHATLAGVVTALAVPLRRPGGGSPLEEAEHLLRPWVGLLILPAFAFANAGVSLAGVEPAALAEPVTLGIAAGLVCGKAVGVFGTTWAMVKAGWADRPAGAGWQQILGVSLLAGIGFTMSLFIGGLAFHGLEPEWAVRVKLGVLGGSLVSAVLGVMVLAHAGRRRAR